MKIISEKMEQVLASAHTLKIYHFSSRVNIEISATQLPRFSLFNLMSCKSARGASCQRRSKHWSLEPGAPVQALPLSGCVSFRKSFTFSEPQFLYLSTSLSKFIFQGEDQMQTWKKKHIASFQVREAKWPVGPVPPPRTHHLLLRISI